MRNSKKIDILKGHNAAVKALVWNPNKNNELISGGGNKDKKIKIWNTFSNKIKQSITTES